MTPLLRLPLPLPLRLRLRLLIKDSWSVPLPHQIQ